MRTFNETFPHGIQNLDDAMRYLTHFHGYQFDLSDYPGKITFTAQYVTYSVTADRVLTMARQYYEEGQRQAEEVRMSLGGVQTALPMQAGNNSPLLIGALIAILIIAVAVVLFFIL